MRDERRSAGRVTGVPIVEHHDPELTERILAIRAADERWQRDQALQSVLAYDLLRARDRDQETP